MLKTGSQHIQTLRDGREVFLNGTKVEDVTTHPPSATWFRLLAIFTTIRAARKMST